MRCCEWDNPCAKDEQRWDKGDDRLTRVLKRLRDDVEILSMCRTEVISVVDEQYVCGYEAGIAQAIAALEAAR